MRHDSTQWISISDVMSGLMLIFLLISVGYMIEIEEEKDKIKSIATAYENSQKALNEALNNEFQKDLKIWNAEILDNNTIRFKDPNMLFQTGRSNLKNDFEKILEDFFPRYIFILTDSKFRDEIEEVRIEGHTSTNWNGAKNKNERYIKNAKLSQDRAFAVLDYCIELPKIYSEVDWLIKRFRANGVSFAKPILQNGVENEELSRRVEFRVITNTEEKIYDILEAFSGK
ncbi:outer membrane protein/peptidoglycan-associated (lipo)protein [Thiovulum sp. ES]|nr:outer membrane protein/peptidoglycan-associated (lipo)protein [Thiovulum sp. ES]